MHRTKFGVGNKAAQFDFEVCRRHTSRIAAKVITSPPVLLSRVPKRRARNDDSSSPIAVKNGDYLGQIGSKLEI